MRPGLDKRLEFAAGVAPATHRDDAVFRSGGNQLIADVGIRLEITFVAPHDATDVFLVLVRSEGEAYVGVSIISVLSVQVGRRGGGSAATARIQRHCVAGGLGTRSSLAPLLVVPIAVPILLAGAQATANNATPT